MNENKKSNLVSVIVPVYNAEKTIYDSLTSILDQSFKNIELIVIDDCSTDNTLFEIKKFTNDNRIKVIQLEKNLGLPGAVRNIGMKLATGNYIAFNDSDDIWKKNKLENQLNFMLKNNLYFSHTSFNESINGKIINELKSNKELNFIKLLRENCIFINTTMFCKRSINEFFPENIKIAEDYFFILQNLSTSNQISKRVEPDDFYVTKSIIAGSVSSNKILGIKCYFKGYREIMGYNILKSIYFTKIQILKTIKKKIKRYL